MPLRINGLTTGSITLAAPNTGTDVTLTLPTTALATESFASSAPGLQLITTQNFSAASTVSVNNCFTSLYQNYLITMHMTTAGTGAASVFRLRASGTDATGSNYNQQRSSVGSTTYTGGRLASQSTWFGHGYVATLNYLIITLFRPNEVEPTAGIAQMGRGTDTAIDMDDFRLGHTLSTAYDGFTMGFGSNSTGTLRVYGYKN